MVTSNVVNTLVGSSSISIAVLCLILPLVHLHLPQTCHDPGPFLIAAPSSVLPNWRAELARWAPGLRVVEYRGSPEAREEIFRKQVERARGPGREEKWGDLPGEQFRELK